LAQKGKGGRGEVESCEFGRREGYTPHFLKGEGGQNTSFWKREKAASCEAEKERHLVVVRGKGGGRSSGIEKILKKNR